MDYLLGMCLPSDMSVEVKPYFTPGDYGSLVSPTGTVWEGEPSASVEDYRCVLGHINGDPPISHQLHVCIPVSYTHLDVYKRQHQYTTQQA